MVSTRRAFKDAVYGEIARMGKAVSAPKRLELLELLAQCPRTVESLAGEAALSVANASQHLQVLSAARLVTRARRGAYVEYRLASEDVEQFVLGVRSLADRHLASLQQLRHDFLAGQQAGAPVGIDELLARMATGDIVVLDVRPDTEFRAGHLVGARSVPLEELRARLDQLPRDRPIVAHCRGPYCVMALDAVATLRSEGFEAHHASAGIADLRARGAAIASSTVNDPHPVGTAR